MSTTHTQRVNWSETPKTHRSWHELFTTADYSTEQVEIVCLLNHEHGPQDGGGVWHRVCAIGSHNGSAESMERNWYHAKPGDEQKAFAIFSQLVSLPSVTFKDLRAAGLKWS